MLAGISIFILRLPASQITNDFPAFLTITTGTSFIVSLFHLTICNLRIVIYIYQFLMCVLDIV